MDPILRVKGKVNVASMEELIKFNKSLKKSWNVFTFQTKKPLGIFTNYSSTILIFVVQIVLCD